MREEAGCENSSVFWPVAFCKANLLSLPHCLETPCRAAGRQGSQWLLPPISAWFCWKGQSSCARAAWHCCSWVLAPAFILQGRLIPWFPGPGVLQGHANTFLVQGKGAEEQLSIDTGCCSQVFIPCFRSSEWGMRWEWWCNVAVVLYQLFGGWFQFSLWSWAAVANCGDWQG